MRFHPTHCGALNRVIPLWRFQIAIQNKNPESFALTPIANEDAAIAQVIGPAAAAPHPVDAGQCGKLRNIAFKTIPHFNPKEDIMSGKTKAWTIGLTALTAAVVAGAVAFAQVRHEPRGSIYGPYYNPHIFNNGTGTISDTLRDPHNDR